MQLQVKWHSFGFTKVKVNPYITVVKIKAMHVRVKMMSKGSKEALTVLIITHVTQVKRVESGVCGSYTTPYADV